jgi:hypothetical protein
MNKRLRALCNSRMYSIKGVAYERYLPRSENISGAGSYGLIAITKHQVTISGPPAIGKVA